MGPRRGGGGGGQDRNLPLVCGPRCDKNDRNLLQISDTFHPPKIVPSRHRTNYFSRSQWSTCSVSLRADLQNLFRPRRITHTDVVPDTAPPTFGSSTPSTERSFGLKVLYEPRAGNASVTQSSTPERTKTVSIVFVHGLGGSARDTWTHAESKTFWPLLLHEEDGLDNIRILTFGYDADFGNVMKPKNVLEIAGFAKQLLEGLDLHYHKYGDVGSLCYATEIRHLLYLLRTVWVDWWLRR